jgi:hypothetical protein
MAVCNTTFPATFLATDPVTIGSLNFETDPNVDGGETWNVFWPMDWGVPPF